MRWDEYFRKRSNVIWRVFISSERDWDEAGVEVYKREWNNKHKFFYDGELVAKISCDRRYRFIHNPEVNDFQPEIFTFSKKISPNSAVRNAVNGGSIGQKPFDHAVQNYLNGKGILMQH